MGGPGIAEGKVIVEANIDGLGVAAVVIGGAAGGSTNIFGWAVREICTACTLETGGSGTCLPRGEGNAEGVDAARGA